MTDATSPTPAMTDALAEWISAIGAEHIITERGVLDQWQTATFATTQKIPAVLRPADSQQAATCVAIANRYLTAIYPISRGRNWGLGSRVPVSDAVVLDLSRLNRIVALDEHFGCLTVEPGVTFQQVHEYLSERGSAWFLPVIGGPADASVLGNCMERGDTGAPQQDRISLYSLEVILASGKIIHTGFERFGQTGLSALSPLAAGPYLDGLFIQSNLGIVTRGTVWLTRVPQQFQIAHAQCMKNGLAALVDALQPLVSHLQGNATFSLWNGHKLLARDPASTLKDLSPEDWLLSAGLYAASEKMAEAQRELVLVALTKVCKTLNVYDEKSIPDLRQHVGSFLGVPSNQNVRSLYLRKPQPIPTDAFDPDRDRCGALWLCPEAPFDGAAVTKAIELCERSFKAFQFSPVLAFHIHSSRSVRMFISIFYDRDVAGEDERAMQCHDEMFAALNAEGFFPFRLGLQSMNVIHKAEGPLWELLDQLKRSLDPNNILAPERYSRL